MKAKQMTQYVAVGQLEGKKPESINSFDDIKDASISAAEFQSNHKGSAWVETIVIKDSPK